MSKVCYTTITVKKGELKMFWNIVLYVYLAVVILNVICVIAIARICSVKIFNLYGKVKFTKIPAGERLFNWIRLIVLCVTPGLNLLMLMVYVFWGEMVIDKTVDTLENRIEPN